MGAYTAFVAKHLPLSKGLDVTCSALAFLILTGARSGEVRYMTWDELNLHAKLWTLPAERMKAKQIHRVPLSKQALAILKHHRGLHDTLVFPSVRDRAPLSDMTPTAFLRRVEAVSDVTGRTATAHTAFVRAFATGVARRGIHAIWRKGLWRTPWPTRWRRPTTALISLSRSSADAGLGRLRHEPRSKETMMAGTGIR